MDEEEGEEGEEIEHLGVSTNTGSSTTRLASGGDRSGAATPSAMSSMSTVPSAGQTPLRQVREVSMVDAPVKGLEDSTDRMDTS